MSAEPPSIAEQIEAVEWALLQAARSGNLRMVTFLEAVLETLKTMEFAREAL
jgi:hypothetical protein